VSARYEIRAASSEDCVFVPPNLYDVIARRSVRKQGVRMVTVGFILVVLVQRVCGWAGFGISWLWFRRLLPLHPGFRDARSGRLRLLADALPLGRLLRLRHAESSALWA